MTYQDRVVKVRLGSQKISIIYQGREESIAWSEIKYIDQLLFLDIPVYKLKLKNRSGYYLFATQSPYANFGFGTRDLSEMGTLIKKKKKGSGYLTLGFNRLVSISVSNNKPIRYGTSSQKIVVPC